MLLVEDDESLRQIVARHLRAQRLRRRRGRLGRGGRERVCRRCRPGLVLLDLNLPGDTGWDLLRGPALAAAGSPPVVDRERDDRQPATPGRVRVAGYLPKPFPLETLVDTVERFLDRRTKRDRP